MNEIKKCESFISTIEFTGNDVVHNQISVLDKDGRLKARDKIEHFESAFKVALGSNDNMENINKDGLKEHFVEGAYIRELFIPKDTAIVSKIWNKTRMWIIATGEVTFTTEMGTQRVKAPYTKIVPHGSKVVLYAHEDTLWFAITGSKATNSDDVEKDVIAQNYEDCSYPYQEKLL